MMKREKTEELGQVFTSDDVARLMVSLVRPHMNPKSRILDPCIGENVFFSHMDDIKVGQLVGIEVDEKLISPSIKDFFSKSDRTLSLKNFFDLSADEKFDVIIMNPPYVRQEKINGSINSKEKFKKQFDGYGFKIPEKSNLYVYFFLKALKHLKRTGVLVAITYDSWLYTDFGKSFKKYLTVNYSVGKIVHFSKGAFDNINIGAAIILVSTGSQRPVIEYYAYDSPEQLCDGNRLSSQRCRRITIDEFLSFNRMSPSDISFDTELFTTMSSLSGKRINRGTNAIVNKFFLFNNEKFPEHMTKIIKDITKVKKYVISDEWKYMLDIKSDEIGENVKDYLQDIKNEVLNSSEKHKSLAEKIKNDDSWYTINTKNPGNVIFNYYMRNNIHFIYNPFLIDSSDNFYNISIKDNVLENLCILNSSFTRYALMKYGRMQGNGLFKIQLYEFNDVPVFNVNQLSTKTKNLLKKVGETLLETERKCSDEVIKEIDELLIKEYNSRTNNNITFEDIQCFVQKMGGGSH